MDDELMVKIRGVTKHYGEVKALDGVDLDVKTGSVLGLLGPNGAGKTTLVLIMATLLKPTSGTVSVAGLNVLSQAQQLRTIIGLTGQFSAVDEDLTGYENLVMFGRLYRLSRKEARQRADELLERFSLTDAAKRLLKTYSGGMRRRLDLASSLINRPPVLFLDEPTTGLDPRSRNELWEIIRELVVDKTTVVLTTQYLEEADQLANSIAVINKGKIIARGTADELKNKSGGNVLEIKVQNKSKTAEASLLIEKLGHSMPKIDREMGAISLPVSGGTTVLIDAVRTLDSNAIAIADIMLRRPTLDDVFLALTGEATKAEEEQAKKKRGGK